MSIRLFAGLSARQKQEVARLVERHFGSFNPLGTYAVYEEGRVKGVVGVGQDDPAPWEGVWLMDLCVDPLERGQGIGTSLVLWAERHGASNLWTDIPSFFRPLGWRTACRWEGKYVMLPAQIKVKSPISPHSEVCISSSSKN